MATYDISTLHPVFVRQMEALAALDIEAVMKNYTDDAVLLRFEGVSVGIDAVRETFTGYLTVKPTLVELQEYIETDDTIFYRAIMNLNGEPEHAFGTLVVRDGRIWRQTAGFQPQDLRRLGGERIDESYQRNTVIVMQAQAAGKQRLEADGAEFGFGERQPLGVGALRIVARHDDVDCAVLDTLDQSAAVVLATHRWRKLEEGAVGADVVLSENEMIR